MKQLFVLFLMQSLALNLFAQNDIHCSYSTLPLNIPPEDLTQPAGYQLLQYNTSGSPTAFTTTAQTGISINHIGINKNNFLYAVEGVYDNDYNILSYNTGNNFGYQLAKSNASWDGNIASDARTDGMAIDKNNNAWVVALSVINNNDYLMPFTTTATGSVSNFSGKPFILATDLASSKVTDIAFDMFNNLYALVLDQLQGHYYIYFANATSITNTENGGTITLTRIWQITDGDNNVIIYNAKSPNVRGENFQAYNSYIAEGLAFSSNGKLLVSVDQMAYYSNSSNIITRKVTNYIYSLELTGPTTVLVDRIPVFTQKDGGNIVTYCQDLASNYFPAFMPTAFDNIDAVMVDNHLQVKWVTTAEREVGKFQVAISTDGINFDNVGQVSTLAEGGNSNTIQTYQFNCGIDGLQQLAFLPFATLLLLAFSKKRRINIAVVTSVALIFTFYSCSKNQNIIRQNYSGKIFVKITAIGAENSAIQSKVVQAIKH